jgi:hypothetical protein
MDRVFLRQLPWSTFRSQAAEHAADFFTAHVPPEHAPDDLRPHDIRSASKHVAVDPTMDRTRRRVALFGAEVHCCPGVRLVGLRSRRCPIPMD